MVQTRKERKAQEQASGDIKLAQPDRSGPTDATLLDFAQDQDLFSQADRRQKKLSKQKARASQNPAANSGGKDEQGEDEEEADDDDSDEDDEDDDLPSLSPGADRALNTLLWGVSLAMLHFMLDVLVQRQYAMEFSWHTVVVRSCIACAVFLLLVFVFHPHESYPTLLPGLPSKYQYTLRQTIFFVTSIGTGCYLIRISNNFGYIAIMKQSPPLGCLWVWSIIELDLAAAVVSIGIASAYFYQGDYKIFTY